MPKRTPETIEASVAFDVNAYEFYNVIIREVPSDLKLAIRKQGGIVVGAASHMGEESITAQFPRDSFNLIPLFADYPTKRVYSAPEGRQLTVITFYA